MNAQRRYQLRKVKELLEESRELIQQCQGEEQDYADNMPDNLQGSEKHEIAEETAGNLEEFQDEIETIIDSMDEYL